MADEFAHITTGVDLSQAEYEGVLAHKFDGQATGDIMYASSNVQLSRLAAGTLGYPLIMGAAIPQWGGAMVLNANLTMSSFGFIKLGTVNAYWIMQGGDATAGGGGQILLSGKGEANPGVIWLYTPDAAGTGATIRLAISGVVATAVAAWTSITHTGLVLSGALTLNGQIFDAGAVSAQITTTGGGFGLEVISTSAGNSGPRLLLYHQSGTPAINDVISGVQSDGYDHLLAQTNYGNFRCTALNVTAGAEEGLYDWYLILAGGANLAMALSAAGRLTLDHSIMFDQDVDSAAVADQVSLSGYEIGAGARALAISQEDPVIVEAVGASDRTLRARINGTTYKIMLHT